MTHPVPTITIETLFPAVSKKNPNIVALIKIAHPAMPAVTSARTKLNVVFAIDISGSMDGQLRNSAPLNIFPQPIVEPVQPLQPHWPIQDPHRITPFGPMLGGARAQPFQPQAMFIPQQRFATKLERVKAAAIKAIAQLGAEDRFGIVIFDGHARTLVESALATSSAKAHATQKIQSLCTGGSTALHAGWKCAAEMVCTNLDAKMVNRVLLLTDGQATDGITDIDTLSHHAATMAAHGVTTSTFGVGDQYNETLLQSMAEKGDGRYYYLEGDANFEQLFAEEFQGMSRMYGREVHLRVHAAENVTLDFHNDLPLEMQGWKLPNAVHEKVEYYLVTLMPSNVVGDTLDFMVAYDYKNENTVHTVNVEHAVGVVSQKSFALMKPNDTVGKKQLELETARAKEKAMQALDRGDYHTSRSILSASANTIMGSAYAAAPEFMAQSARLETLMNVGDSGDSTKLRKMATYDTYATRNNHSDS